MSTKARKKEINRLDRFGMHATLRELIDRSGLSRYEISRRTGIAESVLSRTYNGGHIPTVDVKKPARERVERPNRPSWCSSGSA